ncbi:hypothetical protein NPIL_534091 [Nephila pilipes]|uniref:Uncharacterized protein n=1 Tax=Nephila pilipes TaxID=299642 RepID=A0A8X6P8E7_NEPPI|nr:hypothetical protein NPIL_534091 [Nephila pilipes]
MSPLIHRCQLIYSSNSIGNKSFDLADQRKPQVTDDLYYDTLTGAVNPYVPEVFRCKVFHILYDLAHAGVKVTIKLIQEILENIALEIIVRKNMARDCRKWCRTYMPCQRSEIQCHVSSLLGLFPVEVEKKD